MSFLLFQTEAVPEDEFIREYELENNRGSLYFIQKKEGDVHCVVWDAALVLAKYLEKECSNDERFLANKSVVELGSGVGCVGLVAAFYGGHVTLTDLPQALSLLESNLKKNEKLIAKNKGSAKIQMMDWNGPINVEPCQVILASDCIYYKESISTFINAIDHLSTSSTEIYITQENRSHSDTQTQIWKEFIGELGKFFKINFLPLTDQHEDYRSSDIYLMKLKKLPAES